jgi:AraC-like DNA-binding protein
MAENSRRIVRTVLAHELDDYAASFGYRAVRLGRGSGPNVHRQITFEGIQLQSGLIGFPNAGEKTIPDHQLVVGLSVRGPPGSRWSEHDFSAGTMLLFGPQADATWVNPEGASVQIAHVDLLALRSMAATLGERVRLPEPGSVTLLHPTTSVRRLGSLLGSLGNPLDASVVLPHNPTELLVAVTHVLAETARRSPTPTNRRIDSRRLVRTLVDYADAVGARPSLPELCAAANVSERRLRNAFNDTFDMAPMAYFRLRSLNLSRSQLLEPDASSVTEIAFRLGWLNVGRFAQKYQQVFGEKPSHTIVTTRAHAQIVMSTSAA